jgi:tRNA(adenine34) deaminase
MTHDEYMHLAIDQAVKAQQMGEVPVGAVLVDEGGKILAAAHNKTISLHDPTGHAEILTLREYGEKVLNYRLLNTTLYVTLEPCVMCMGAIIHARVARVVFGAADPKWGAAGSVYNFPADERLNHKPDIIRDVCEESCRTLIQTFFRSRRKSVATNQFMS